MSLVYLAGPIDAAPEGSATGWREHASLVLANEGIVSFSPAHAFSGPESLPSPETCDGIVAINDRAIQESDLVLANLSGQSFGTPLEVKLALDLGKHVVAFGASPRSIYRHRWHNADHLEQATSMAVSILTPPGPSPDTLAMLHEALRGG